MEKTLSKTKKVKRLRALKIKLKAGDFFMCLWYDTRFDGELFDHIPELHKFRPRTNDFKALEKETYGKSHAWHWDNGDTRIKKISAIDKAIKLIQSK